MQKEVENDTSLSRRLNLIVGLICFAPLLVLVSFFTFPYLEKHNLGYAFFHWASVCAALFSLGSFIFWLQEKRYDGNLKDKILGILIWIEILGFLAIRAFGDFYWAFGRGYFLD